MDADTGARVVRHAPPQAAAIAAVLAAAFAQDPFNCWLLPDTESRPARLRRGFGLLTAHVYMITGEGQLSADGEAAALWARPGAWRLSTGQQLRLLPGFARTFGRGLPRALSGFALLDRHHPDAPPHWYLAAIGVRPAQQRRGKGSTLLAPMLARCDADGLPAYLETSNPANLPFYTRAGFGVREEFDLPRGPRIWTMWREPRDPRRGSG